MKKILSVLSATVLSATIGLLIACEGPMGPQGEPGADMTYHVENITVKSGDWKLISVGRYATLYECIRDVDVREEAYERGLVNVYMFQWSTSGNSEVQTPLPYWIQHTDGSNTWLEGYNYDFDKGTVAFYAEYRNGEIPPECSFRIVVAP